MHVFTGLPCKLPIQRKSSSVIKRGGGGKGKKRKGKRRRCSDSESSSESEGDSSEEEWQPWKEETRKKARGKGTIVCNIILRLIYVSDCQLCRRLLPWIFSPNSKYSLL